MRKDFMMLYHLSCTMKDSLYVKKVKKEKKQKKEKEKMG
jgi:hypothetical protein